MRMLKHTLGLPVLASIFLVCEAVTAAANAVAPMVGAALPATWGLSSAFLGAATMYGLATFVVATAVPARAREEPQAAAG